MAAIHPGYGFLSENWRFAEACREAGVTFVGPPPEVLRTMGDKTEARRIVGGAGVPVLPGSDGAVGSAAAAREVADTIGYPVMLKAAAGGGGIGMALVPGPERIEAAFAAAQRRVQSAFGETAVYVERAVERPRHVEVQILADDARPTDPPLRAGLLDPATASEARGGVAGARARPRPSIAATRGGGARRDRRRIPERRHRRVPGRGRPVLLPRGERAAPGRASGDRGGRRARSRRGAAPDRRRGAARLEPGGRRGPGRRDRVPDLRRGPGPGLPAVAGHHHRRRPAGGARAPPRVRRRAGERGHRSLRPAPGEADRRRARPGRGARTAGRARSSATGSRG